MAGITHVANFTTRLGSSFVPRLGFGTPLLVAFHTNFPQLIKRYEGPPSAILSALVTDGFVAGSAINRMASRVLGQTTAPPVLYVGRLTSAITQSVEITPLNLVEGTVYSLALTNTQGTETVTYTVQAADTATDIATGIAAAVAGATTVTDLASTDNTGSVSIGTDTAGDTFAMDLTVNDLRQPDVDYELLDESTHTGTDAQLTAIEAENQDWYALLMSVESDSIIAEVSTWISTRAKMYIPAISDSNAGDPLVTTDPGSDAAVAVNNQVQMLHEPVYRDYTNCAIAGKVLPEQPGSATWNAQVLSNVTPADYATSYHSTLASKRYTTLRALNRIQSMTDGGFVSGNYLYADILRSFHWIEARSEEALTNLIRSNKKIPFDRFGQALIKSALEQVVANGIALKMISAGDPSNPIEDPEPTVFVPNLGDPGAQAVDRAARRWSNVIISGRFTGAVHSVTGEIVMNI